MWRSSLSLTTGNAGLKPKREVIIVSAKIISRSVNHTIQCLLQKTTDLKIGFVRKSIPDEAARWGELRFYDADLRISGTGGS
jgi:hypothetical protein